MPKVELRHVA